jgi:hypothetical protein
VHPLQIALTLLVLALPLRAAAQLGAYGDAPVFARIESLRPIAEALVIDGDDADWTGIPALSDPAGDAAGESARDITSVSIAPLASALLVRIATAAPPPADGLAFWLEIDYRGELALDLQIGLYAGFPDILWTYPEDAGPAFQSWDDSELATGSVVEARIPYAALAPALPAEMASALSGAAARGWLRVWVFSTHPTRSERLDQAVVASYRIGPTPFALDAPRPALAGSALGMAMPLDGAWLVAQGPFTRGSHAGSWAYDFAKVDAELLEDDPHPGTANADYFSFGATVRAPLAGQVRFARGSEPDQPPRQFPAPGALSNLVQIDAASGDRSVSLYHLKQGSVPLDAGASVAAGQVVGEVGNSVVGWSWPHLHLQAELPAGGSELAPIALREVEVQLNPGDADPWERRLASWEIREGVLVRPARALCGDLDLDRALGPGDAALYRLALAGAIALPQAALERCSVRGAAGPCELADSVVLRRQLANPPLAPAISQGCAAAIGPS